MSRTPDHRRPKLRLLPVRASTGRAAVAEWLVATLRERIPTIVGIDHGFSFPLAYFERHRLAPEDWPVFLDDF
jgi:hypothetical protein